MAKSRVGGVLSAAPGLVDEASGFEELLQAAIRPAAKSKRLSFFIRIQFRQKVYDESIFANRTPSGLVIVY